MTATLPKLRSLASSVWVRALVSLGMVVFVASRIKLSVVVDHLSGGHWWWFGVAVLVLLGALMLAATRWHLFLRAALLAEALPETMRIYAIGAFTTNFLPTGFGGDAVRVWLAGSPGTRVRAGVTVVIDRATLLFSIVVFAWLALAADSASVPTTLTTALSAVTALLVAGAAVAALVSRLGDRILGPALGEVRAAAFACLRGWSLLAKTSLLGVLYEGLTVLALWLVARSIRLDVPFSVLAVTLPPVLVLTALPISIAGFGVRETSYVLLLHSAGVSATDATLLSVFSTVLFAIASLPGAVAMLDRTRRRSSETDGLPRLQVPSTEPILP